MGAMWICLWIWSIGACLTAVWMGFLVWSIAKANYGGSPWPDRLTLLGVGVLWIVFWPLGWGVWLLYMTRMWR